jgi:mannose-1-phosphate guanylyltransferase/mannose-6-phosphate isomerase
MSKLTPVIMCGGAGTRLWPVSRESMPKQFVPLVGQGSTFQQVMRRVSNSELFGRAIVITHSDFRFIVAEQLRDCGLEADIVLEPARRDSGPAVAVAAALAAERDPKALVVVLASDHFVQDTEGFISACRDAATAAAEGLIVTFGVSPTHAATNYGYIRPGKKLNGGAALSVEAFVEKPSSDQAAIYVKEHYLWNSGNFVFRADTMLDELTSLEPEIAAAAKLAVAGRTRDLDFTRLREDAFISAPRKSIDYAVMERTSRAAVVPADMKWSDVGSWSAVWENLEHDQAGNSLKGPATAVDSSNCLVLADDSIVTAVVGLKDTIVVANQDAVLVVARDKAEQVKLAVDQLKNQNRREAIEHRQIFRPWGHYQSIDTGSRYQVKRIVVKPGAQLSLQKHFHRAEHWVVVKGTAEVTNGDQVQTLHENESVYIPIGSVHRLGNPGKIPLELIEVQVGSYLGEDDIVRFKDEYGRGKHYLEGSPSSGS